MQIALTNTQTVGIKITMCINNLFYFQMYNSSFKVLEEVKILAEEWSNGTQDLGEFLSNSDVLSNIKVRIRLHCNVFICTCTLQLNPNGENFCFSHILIGSYGFYNYRFHTEYNLIAELNVLILLSEMITTKHYGRPILINHTRCNFVCIFYNKGNETGITVCVILLKL